jgi:hypothetical protein
MKFNWLCLLAAGPGLFVAPSAVLAHHSFAAEFDAAKKITLKGVVTKLDWMNPHMFIYLDVKDENGAVTHWQCEGGPPNTLMRQGWTRMSVKVGDEISIDGSLAKDGSKLVNSRTVKLADGRTVTAASSGGQTDLPSQQ